MACEQLTKARADADASELDPELKKQVLAEYDSALEHVKRAGEFEAAAAEHRTAAENVEAATQDAVDALEQDSDPSYADLLAANGSRIAGRVAAEAAGARRLRKGTG